MEQNFTIYQKLLFSYKAKFIAVLVLLCFSFSTQAEVQVSIDASPISCNGANDGTATANPFGGWEPYTYAWSTGATTASITGLAPGIYTVTVVDIDGAIGTASTEIAEPPTLGSILNTSPANCAGGSGGSIFAVTFGGTPSYSYAWSNGATTQSISNLTAGTYTVTITDANGCTMVNSAEVIQGNNSLSVFVSASYETCAGSADGTASVNVSGGVGQITFEWSNGQTGVVATGLSAGTYTVTATDVNGCTGVGSVDVELSPEGVWIMINTTPSDCGSNNGTAYAGVMTGVAPYTYIWSNGGTTQTITGLAPGSYTVTVTDSNGCTNAESGTVGQNSNLNVSATSTNANCGANDGTATASVSGGSGNFTYAWSNGGNTQTITGLAPGTYTVTATDDTGCEGSATVVITGDTPDGGEISTTDETTICAGDGTDDIINVTLTGNTGPNNQWIITNAAGEILALPAGPPFNLEGAGPGVCLIWHLSYEGTVNGLAVGQNANNLSGCFDLSNSIAITRNSTTAGDITTNDPTTICVGDGLPNPINVTVNGSVTGTNQAWIITNDLGEILALPAGPPFDLEGAGVGVCLIWYISYEDGLMGLAVGQNANNLSGCFDLSNPITVTRIECCDANAGTISGPASTCFAGGPTMISATPDGNAVVPMGYQTLYVLTSGPGLVIEQTNATPNFTVNATGNYTIHTLVYDPNTLDLSGVMPGVTTGFDINALLIQGGGSICASLDVAGAPVSVNDGPSVSLTGTDISCNGANDGSISSSVSGGSGSYTYNWSNGATTANLTGLAAGTYDVTVTDSDGCVGTASVTISEPTAVSVSVTGTDEDCPGSNNGSATASPSGGTGGYTYNWSNGGNTMTISNLAAGTYDVTVTDANACTATGSVTIVSNGITSCSAMVTSSYNEGVDISTFGGNDGTASASVNGGIAPYSYLWSNGQTGADASNLSAGTYDVTITAANGCSCAAQVTLVDPSKVGNFVWEDDNENGIQDPGESQGIAGVNVTLTGTSNDGVAVNRMTTTNGNGVYTFDGLPAGDYKVSFEEPSGYKASPTGQGGDTNLDSNADPITGMSEVFSLAAATCDNSYDAGYYPCVNIGDFVFYDGNHDGIQQPWEAGFQGAIVTLYSAGPDGVICTADDVEEDAQITGGNGRYLFECVDPGQYYIRFAISGDQYTLTGQDQGGDDELDSDANPATGKTDPFTVTEGMADDLSYDAGVFQFCDDFDTGGAIQANQTICAGEIPDELTSVSLPSGGTGNAEYLWLSSITGGPIGSGWTPIANSDSPNYTPGQLYQTTYFIRCARREGCADFVTESNEVVITVVPFDPNTCNGNTPLVGNLTADIVAGSGIMLKWTTDSENELFNYQIERAAYGQDFEEIGTVIGQGNNAGGNDYYYEDAQPRMGVNTYRIKRVELNNGNFAFSNEVSVTMTDGASNFFVYPNPAKTSLHIEAIYQLENGGVIEVYDATGLLINTFAIEASNSKVDINLAGYSSGIYFLRVQLEGQDDSEILRVVKE